LKNGYQLILAPVIKMNWGTNRAVIEAFGDILFERH